ncbi:hypothetical protein ANRL4_03039 [Anaerolineae bacterium]|nr:hypothetical protein ANRL4_03039 [Anaerolineae bacterium]
MQYNQGGVDGLGLKVRETTANDLSAASLAWDHGFMESGRCFDLDGSPIRQTAPRIWLPSLQWHPNG